MSLDLKNIDAEYIGRTSCMCICSALGLVKVIWIHKLHHNIPVRYDRQRLLLDHKKADMEAVINTY